MHHDVEENLKMFGFSEKRPLTGKFQKLCSGRIDRVIHRRVVLKFRGLCCMGNWNVGQCPT